MPRRQVKHEQRTMSPFPVKSTNGHPEYIVTCSSSQMSGSSDHQASFSQSDLTSESSLSSGDEILNTETTQSTRARGIFTYFLQKFQSNASQIIKVGHLSLTTIISLMILMKHAYQSYGQDTNVGLMTINPIYACHFFWINLSLALFLRRKTVLHHFRQWQLDLTFLHPITYAIYNTIAYFIGQQTVIQLSLFQPETAKCWQIWLTIYFTFLLVTVASPSKYLQQLDQQLVARVYTLPLLVNLSIGYFLNKYSLIDMYFSITIVNLLMNRYFKQHSLLNFYPIITVIFCSVHYFCNPQIIEYWRERSSLHHYDHFVQCTFFLQPTNNKILEGTSLPLTSLRPVTCTDYTTLIHCT